MTDATSPEPAALRSPATSPAGATGLAPSAAAATSDALSRRTRALLLVLPLVGLGLAYLLTRGLGGSSRANQMAAAAAASFLGLGTTVIFGSAVLGDASFVHLTTVELALVVVVLNTALGIVFVGSLDLLERVPWVGPRLASARAAAREMAARRAWIKRFATAGVALFVITPLPGSGSLGGTMIGRVVGLSRTRTFLAVAVANAVVCAIYAAGAGALGRWMAASQMTLGQRIAVLLGTLLLVVLLVRALRARGRSGASAAAS